MEEETKGLKAAKPSTGGRFHGEFYSYFKFLEYACVIDVALKVMSIVIPEISFIKNNRVYTSDTCRQMLSATRIILYVIRGWSIVISIIGILAVINYNYRLMETFGRQMTYYCLVELLSLLFTIIITTITTCSPYNFYQRIHYILFTAGGGITFLAAYYAVWVLVAGKCLEYLQNGRQEIRQNQMPDSFEGYDAVDSNEHRIRQRVEAAGIGSVSYDEEEYRGKEQDRRKLKHENAIDRLLLSNLPKRSTHQDDKESQSKF